MFWLHSKWIFLLSRSNVSKVNSRLCLSFHRKPANASSNER